MLAARAIVSRACSLEIHLLQWLGNFLRNGIMRKWKESAFPIKGPLAVVPRDKM